MKKILFIAAAVTMLVSCQEKKLDRFEREAKEYTQKKCPLHMDSVTTLDSMVFVNKGEGNLRMYYSLNISEEQKEAFMNMLGDIGDENLGQLRSSVEYIKHKDAGVTFSYIYMDAVTGEKLVEYSFTKQEYGN